MAVRIFAREFSREMLGMVIGRSGYISSTNNCWVVVVSRCRNCGIFSRERSRMVVGKEGYS